MPEITIGNWTKQKLKEIKEEEEHRSDDSLIKSLIRDKESHSKTKQKHFWDPPRTDSESDVMVLAEGIAMEGEKYLTIVCPNCSKYLFSLHVMESSKPRFNNIVCRNCGTKNHNEHSLIAINNESAEHTLFLHELKELIKSYWGRYFQDEIVNKDVYDVGRIAELFYDLSKEMGWDWSPPDVPVNELKRNYIYKIPEDNSYLQVLDDQLHSDRIRVIKWKVDENPIERNPELIEENELIEMLSENKIIRTFEAPKKWLVINTIKKLTETQEPIPTTRIISETENLGLSPDETRRILDDLKKSGQLVVT